MYCLAILASDQIPEPASVGPLPQAGLFEVLDRIPSQIIQELGEKSYGRSSDEDDTSPSSGIKRLTRKATAEMKTADYTPPPEERSKSPIRLSAPLLVPDRSPYANIRASDSIGLWLTYRKNNLYEKCCSAAFIWILVYWALVLLVP